MSVDNTQLASGQILILLLELECLEEQLSAPEIKVHDARSILTQIETIRSDYLAFAGKLSSLGAPIPKEECRAVVKRLSAARSHALTVCPTVSMASSGSDSGSGSGTVQVQAKLPQINLPIFAGDIAEWISWSRALQV